jgi:hypothetical protein
LLVQAPRRPQAAAVLSPVFPSLALSPAPEAALSALARFSAEVVQPVLRPAGSEASAQPGVALQPGEPAALDAPVPPEQAVAAWVAVEVPLQAAAVPGALAGQQQAARHVEVLRPEAQHVEVLQPEVPGERAAELPSAVLPLVVLPLAAAWVFRRDQALPWPVPQPMAQFARATACLQIALPSERWWQAATNEVLS